MEDQRSAIIVGRMLGQKTAALTVLLAVIVLYFWGHNTGERPALLAGFFARTAGAAIDLLTVGLLAAAAGGLGRRLTGRLPLKAALSLPEQVALTGACGLGIISVGALLFGLVGAFHAAMWAPILLLVVVLHREVRAWLGDARRVLAGAMRPDTGWSRFVTIWCGGLLALALLFALAPPFHWDAMTYHLEGPERYLQAGRVTTQPDNHFMGFPQAQEVLYGLVLSLSGRDTTAAAVHFLHGMLALTAVAGLIGRHANRTAAYTGVFLLLSSFSIWLLFGIPYVDLAMMAYGTCALVALVEWDRSDRAGWLMLAGIFAGFALGTKYTAAVLIGALLFYVVVRERRRFLRPALLVGIAVLIVFLPWMLKGVLLYENPVYPYVFGGVSWDATRSANFNAPGAGFLNSSEWWWHLPVLPLTATVFGWRRLDERAQRLARVCVLLALPLLVFWVFMTATSGIGSQPRLQLVGVAVPAVLGSLAFYSISRWPRRPLDVYFILRIMLAFTVLLSLPEILQTASRSRLVDYYAGTISREQYLNANLGIYYPALRQLETLPEGSDVLFLWEPRSYYCPAAVRCTPDVLFDNWARAVAQYGDADEAMDGWQRTGIDYLLVYGLESGSNIGYDFWLERHDYMEAANRAFPEALAAHWEPVWSDGFGYTLYARRSG